MTDLLKTDPDEYVRITRQKNALDEMIRLAEEEGLYDVDMNDVLELCRQAREGVAREED